jgi:DNA recombination protein RmuC
MDPTFLIVTAVAVLAALVLGWWIGGRPAAALVKERDAARQERDGALAQAEDWRRKFGEIGINLAAEAEKSARIPALESALEVERQAAAAARSEADRLRPVADRVAALDRELHELRAEKVSLSKAKAALEEGEAVRRAEHEKQLAQLRELETKVEARFADLASKAVDGAHDRFLKQAAERFGHAEKQSEEKLKALLQPVETSLKRYDEKLDQIEKARNSSYGELQAAVRLLHDGHAQVRDETRNLVNALRASPKARGRWGEQSLKNVLEQAGLSPFSDFQTEVSVDTEDGRLRPDVIVRLPGGRKLIIDAKCSLNAFLDANDAADDDSRKSHLKAHAAAIKRHAEQLGSKNYWDRFGDAADYVVMYIPGEHFLTAALEQDDGLWGWAFERRVLLATPTNLVAIARTVATVWRQEKLAEQAAEIARLGKELHARLATMGNHVSRLGRNLGLATGAYNDFVGSLETQVMTQAKRFEALEVASGAKEIDTLPIIEASPRPLAKLTVELIEDD